MSLRDNISANIVSVLGDMARPVLKKVTREPFELKDLSQAQFPAVWVSTETETRNDATMGGSALTRFGEIDYSLYGYMKGYTEFQFVSEKAEEYLLTEASDDPTSEGGTGYETDRVRDELIEGISEILDADRTRGGYAKNTEIISIEDDDSVFFPYGAVRVTARVTYHFTTGTT